MNLRVSLPALALAALMAGCTRPNNASLEFHGICYPPAAEACSYGSTCTAQVLGNHAVDLDLTSSLFLAVQMNNQLTNNKSDTGQVNTHDAFVQQAVISYDAPGFSVADVTTNLQQTVPAAGTAVIGVEMLNDTSAASLSTGVGAAGSAEVIMNLKLKGVMGDGSEFETGEYRIPVTVCRGCLTAYFTCPASTPSLTAVCPNVGQAPATKKCE